jgi:Caspase domain
MRRSILLAFLALCLGIIAAPAFADNRVALVIDDGAYAHVPHLPTPPHDAEDVAAALKRTGFQTIVGIDLDQAGIQDAVPPPVSLAVPPASIAPASSPRIDRLEDIKPGLVSLSKARTVKDSNISTGQRPDGGSPKIISVSKNISIKLGTTFGVQVRIVGKPVGVKVPIKVTWRYPQPGLKNPVTGTTKFIDEYLDSRPLGESPVFYWNLAEAWTLVPGVWTLELSQDGRTLLVQDFVLSKQ